jgi:hypothetical protein
MPHMKIRVRADDGADVTMSITLADDGVYDHLEAFARFLQGASFERAAIEQAMRDWISEFGVELP